MVEPIDRINDEAPGDGGGTTGSILGDNYWQILTATGEVSIRYQGVDIVLGDPSLTNETQYTPSGSSVTYYKGDLAFQSLLVSQYNLSATPTSGGGDDTGGGDTNLTYWLEKADYDADDNLSPVLIVWAGDTILDGVLVEGNLSYSPPGSDFTYTRGAPTTISGMSSSQTYNVTQTSNQAPVDLGDPTDIGGVSQGDYGIQVLNSSGNEVWGGGQRVMSFMNEVRTHTVTYADGSFTATDDIDLTEFGWELNNRSEIDIYIRSGTIQYVRTSTGVTVTLNRTYNIGEIPVSFSYYLMRF